MRLVLIFDHGIAVFVSRPKDSNTEIEFKFEYSFALDELDVRRPGTLLFNSRPELSQSSLDRSEDEKSITSSFCFSSSSVFLIYRDSLLQVPLVDSFESCNSSGYGWPTVLGHLARRLRSFGSSGIIEKKPKIKVLGRVSQFLSSELSDDMTNFRVMGMALHERDIESEVYE